MTPTLSDLKAMDAKATKGEWRILDWADERKGFIAVIGDGDPPKHICDIFPFGKRAEAQSREEHETNAAFIVACVAYVRAELAKPE